MTKSTSYGAILHRHLTLRCCAYIKVLARRAFQLRSIKTIQESFTQSINLLEPFSIKRENKTFRINQPSQHEVLFTFGQQYCYPRCISVRYAVSFPFQRSISCSHSSLQTNSHLVVPFLSRAVPEPQGGPIEPCTSTLTRFVQFDLSPTETIYVSTVTSIASLDCAGCGVLDIRQIGGPGPVGFVFSSKAFLNFLIKSYFFRALSPSLSPLYAQSGTGCQLTKTNKPAPNAKICIGPHHHRHHHRARNHHDRHRVSRHPDVLLEQSTASMDANEVAGKGTIFQKLSALGWLSLLSAFEQMTSE